MLNIRFSSWRYNRWNIFKFPPTIKHITLAGIPAVPSGRFAPGDSLTRRCKQSPRASASAGSSQGAEHGLSSPGHSPDCCVVGSPCPRGPLPPRGGRIIYTLWTPQHLYPSPGQGNLCYFKEGNIPLLWVLFAFLKNTSFWKLAKKQLSFSLFQPVIYLCFVYPGVVKIHL